MHVTLLDDCQHFLDGSVVCRTTELASLKMLSFLCLVRPVCQLTVRQMASDSEEENPGDSVTQLRKSQFDFFEFNLGQFCARRVRVYHALSHWEVGWFLLNPLIMFL